MEPLRPPRLARRGGAGRLHPGHHGGMPHRHAAVDQEWRAVRAADPADSAGPDHGRITFLGHSTVLVEVDDLRILIDPVLRDGLGPVRRQVRSILPELFADLDAVFISHGHHDHLDLASLRQIPGHPTVIVPRGFAGIARRAGLGPVEEVGPGDQLTIDRVRFSVVQALHSGKREPFGPTGPAIGCVVGGLADRVLPGRHGPVPGHERPGRAPGPRAAARLGLGTRRSARGT